MNIRDLVDTDFRFHLLDNDEDFTLWEYEFEITNGREKYYLDIDHSELKQLINNCKRILQATQNQGGI